MSLLILGSVTSTVTSAMTVTALQRGSIDGVESLASRRVGVVRGSLGHSFLESQGMVAVTASSLLSKNQNAHKQASSPSSSSSLASQTSQTSQVSQEQQKKRASSPRELVVYHSHRDLVHGVAHRQVDAGVGQANVLEYMTTIGIGRGLVRLSGNQFQQHGMGFALGVRFHRHVEEINAALLDLQDTPHFDALVKAYFNDRKRPGSHVTKFF